MTYFIIGFLVGGALGVLVMSMVGVGALADARAEMADCRARVRRLIDETHA